jgi:hypothetical protein
MRAIQMSTENRARAWRFLFAGAWLSMDGRRAEPQRDPRLCCDRGQLVHCVCEYRCECPVHGGACHGSHD